MKQALLALSLLALCVTSVAQKKTFFVKPSVTDPAYTTAQDSHFVCVNLTVNPLNKLLVFLPGTGAQAKHYQLIPGVAADLGYHCINIAYPNAEAAASCASQAATDCYTKFRQEVCYGMPGSDQIDVDSLNSIYTRLVKTLQYLNSSYPNDNWGQYLSNGKPNWTKIATAGHSQGSGHALFLAKANSVDRVLMFGGPQDYNYIGGFPAPWIGAQGATDTTRLYSFLHIQDEISPYEIQYKALNAMGLLADNDSTWIDPLNSPYNNSHCLYTRATPKNSSTNFHNSMAVDFYTPGTISAPTFKAVWTYMLSRVDNSGLSESLQANWSLYPNPTSGLIQLQSSKTSQDVNIFDDLGKIIIQTKTNNSGITTLDLRTAIPGIYFIQIGSSVKKVVVER